MDALTVPPLENSQHTLANRTENSDSMSKRGRDRVVYIHTIFLEVIARLDVTFDEGLGYTMYHAAIP